MFIKNMGQKIVHIGNVMILPDQVVEISGDMTSPLSLLISKGILEEVRKAAPSPEGPEGKAAKEADTETSKKDTAEEVQKESPKGKASK